MSEMREVRHVPMAQGNESHRASVSTMRIRPGENLEVDEREFYRGIAGLLARSLVREGGVVIRERGTVPPRPPRVPRRRLTPYDLARQERLFE